MAVRPEKAKNLGRLGREANFANRDQVALLFLQPFDLNHRSDFSAFAVGHMVLRKRIRRLASQIVIRAAKMPGKISTARGQNRIYGRLSVGGSHLGSLWAVSATHYLERHSADTNNTADWLRFSIFDGHC
jgi:hypothetical protein